MANPYAGIGGTGPGTNVYGGSSTGTLPTSDFSRSPEYLGAQKAAMIRSMGGNPTSQMPSDEEYLSAVKKSTINSMNIMSGGPGSIMAGGGGMAAGGLGTGLGMGARAAATMRNPGMGVGMGGGMGGGYDNSAPWGSTRADQREMQKTQWMHNQFTPAVTNREHGGPVVKISRMIRPYIVNENGEEMYQPDSGGPPQIIRGGEQVFFPPENGRIIPHKRASRIAMEMNIAPPEHRGKGGDALGPVDTEITQPPASKRPPIGVDPTENTHLAPNARMLPNGGIWTTKTLRPPTSGLDRFYNMNPDSAPLPPQRHSWGNAPGVGEAGYQASRQYPTALRQVSVPGFSGPVQPGSTEGLIDSGYGSKIVNGVEVPMSQAESQQSMLNARRQAAVDEIRSKGGTASFGNAQQAPSQAQAQAQPPPVKFDPFSSQSPLPRPHTAEFEAQVYRKKLKDLVHNSFMDSFSGFSPASRDAMRSMAERPGSGPTSVDPVKIPENMQRDVDTEPTRLMRGPDGESVVGARSDFRNPFGSGSLDPSVGVPRWAGGERGSYRNYADVDAANKQQEEMMKEVNAAANRRGGWRYEERDNGMPKAPRPPLAAASRGDKTPLEYEMKRALENAPKFQASIDKDLQSVQKGMDKLEAAKASTEAKRQMEAKREADKKADKEREAKIAKLREIQMQQEREGRRPYFVTSPAGRAIESIGKGVGVLRDAAINAPGDLIEPVAEGLSDFTTGYRSRTPAFLPRR